ncbi:MAG: NAD(P)/FAD-dependent oxidoreductase [Bacillota bacterium]|nr:NAD(P)/FAD-dependent oxidoreductase [Bacillota bacterium]
MSKKVLIVGAGYAGISAALTFSKRKKNTDVDVTVIDRNNYQTLMTELHEVAGNRVEQDAIKVPLNRVFQYTDIKHYSDDIKSFDFEANVVKGAEKEYKYDYLILALGSQTNYYGIPGLKENSFSLWSYDDAVRIREHIKMCCERARGEEDEARRRSLLTFAVAGAGFTGIEMIGELIHWIRTLSSTYNLNKKEFRLILCDALPNVLAQACKDNQERALRYLKKKGVEVMLGSPVKEATSEGFRFGDQFIPTRTLIWCAGIRASDEVDGMGVEVVNRSARTKVDEYNRLPKYRNVYSVGDMAGTLDKEGKMYPAMVEHAHHTGHQAALNILRDIRGEGLKKTEVNMRGYMLSIGNYFYLNEMMGKRFPGWIGMFAKYFVNSNHMLTVAGFWGVAKYLYHESVERRQRRIFLERHWSEKMQAWWLLPLRLFTGGYWIYEAVKKIGEGWMDKPVMGFMKSTLNIGDLPTTQVFYRINLGIFRWGVYAEKLAPAAPDTASSATTATTSAVAAAVSNAPAATSSATTAVTAAASAVSDKLGETFSKLDFAPLNWVTTHWILGSDASTLFFQRMIIIIEILLGLAIIAGAFTFIASGISILLNINFMATTGLYLSVWWFPVALFALMGGAGRAFGLDYYIMPYLNNVWERWIKGGKFSLSIPRAFDRHSNFDELL